MKDVWWVRETTVLTISAYLLVLTQRDQGHGWMRLPYHHIYICRANPELLAKLLLLFFFLRQHYASGFQVGFFFPVQAQCRLWALEQCCVHWAGKKLHVAIFTSHYVRELPVTSFSKRVWLYTHIVLPNQINLVVSRRDYLCNTFKVITFFFARLKVSPWLWTCLNVQMNKIKWKKHTRGVKKKKKRLVKKIKIQVKIVVLHLQCGYADVWIVTH